MSLTTIDINGTQYPSYATVAEADIFLQVDPVRATAWAALTADQKGINLIAATRRLDLENWSGEKTDPAQETDWPRDNAMCNGTPIPDGLPIPTEIESGCCSIAGTIAIDASASQAGTGPSNTKKVGAGSAAVEFFRPQTGSNYSLSAQNPDAYALVRCLLQGAGAASGIGYGVASGTCDQSSFDDVNEPSVSQGYP